MKNKKEKKKKELSILINEIIVDMFICIIAFFFRV